MSSPQIPTTSQLQAARLLRWHQSPAGETPSEPALEGVETPEPPASAAHRLLTLESLKHFLDEAGLLLFAPRPQLAASPAPSIVEATLGRAEAEPSLADTAGARSLVARLVTDGSAIALNLLGAPGTTAESPDFIVSAAVFPYIFTLRGDKLWKQPPANAGAVKVSPLAANAFTVLAESGPRTAADLASELGKGLTEAAVLRALGELWQHLRILPVPQADGSATLWEMATTRFTKQIKAGANAGQPTALSALASLYLRQVLLATEDEIETFLSPLAPRSRVRDVLHGLLAAQQLEPMVVEGRQCLFITDEPPVFDQVVAAASEPVSSEENRSEPVSFAPAAEGSRIRRFASDKAAGAPLRRGKPFSPGKRGGADDRERRPFRRDAAAAGGAPVRRPRSAEQASVDGPPRARRRPDFADRARERSGSPVRSDQGPRTGAGPAYRKPPFGSPGDQERGGKPSSPSARSFSADRARPASGDRPRPASGPRQGGWGPPARGDRGTRSFAAGAVPDAAPGSQYRRPDDDRQQRPERPAFRRFDAPRGGSVRKPPFPRRDDRSEEASGAAVFPPSRPRREATARPDRAGRPAFGARPDRAGKPAFAGRPGRTGKPAFGAKPDRAGKPAWSGKPKADRGPGFDRGPRPDRAAGPARGPRPDRSGGPAFASRAPFASRAARPAGDRPKFRPSPQGAARPSRPDRDAGTSARKPFAGKPAWKARPAAGASRSGDRPSGPRGAAAPGTSPFDKFKGAKKPWGKRPPPRKIRPVEDEA